MATYNVYLQNRLTEMEVIITQLVQKNTFSIDNLMYLLFSINELNLYKQISSETNMEIDTKLENLLEMACELINQKIYLNTKVDLSSEFFCDTNVNLELKTKPIEIYKKFLTGGNSCLEIFTQALDYYIAHSLGTVNYNVQIKLDQLQSLKEDFEELDNQLKLLLESNFSSSKIAELENLNMGLSISQIGLFYLIIVSGELNSYLNISSIDDYVLKKVLYGFYSNMILSVENSKIPFLEKFANVEDILTMLVTMIDILNQFIVLKQSNTVLSCEASVMIKRYRLVSEMDEFDISTFNNLNLFDIDFKLED